MRYKSFRGMFISICILGAVLGGILFPQAAHAKENDIYDSLRESIHNTWDDGMEGLEDVEEIKIKGNLAERIIRSIANTLYKNLASIKAWSIVIGGISFILGIFTAFTAKLNKKLKRFAISFLVVTLPLLLTIFVFGATKLISIFI